MTTIIGTPPSAVQSRVIKKLTTQTSITTIPGNPNDVWTITFAPRTDSFYKFTFFVSKQTATDNVICKLKFNTTEEGTYWILGTNNLGEVGTSTFSPNAAGTSVISIGEGQTDKQCNATTINWSAITSITVIMWRDGGTGNAFVEKAYLEEFNFV